MKPDLTIPYWNSDGKEINIMELIKQDPEYIACTIQAQKSRIDRFVVELKRIKSLVDQILPIETFFV